MPDLSRRACLFTTLFSLELEVDLSDLEESQTTTKVVRHPDQCRRRSLVNRHLVSESIIIHEDWWASLDTKAIMLKFMIESDPICPETSWLRAVSNLVSSGHHRSLLNCHHMYLRLKVDQYWSGHSSYHDFMSRFCRRSILELSYHQCLCKLERRKWDLVQGHFFEILIWS